MDSARNVWLWAALAVLLTGQAHADDIDIYLDSAAPSSTLTRIMLALDFRRANDAVLCQDAASNDCQSAFGARLRGALDLFGTVADEHGVLGVELGADGVPDIHQRTPREPGTTVAERYWPGARVYRPDLLRAALRVVLGEASARLAASPSAPGLEVGLIIPHANTCPGAGPAYLPDYGRSPPLACSRGAYILQGFIDVRDPGQLQVLFEKLAAVPEPGVKAAWMRQPWPGHPYAIRDIYMELFRYLTGQAVFNGFLGADDYGSRMSGNLYHDGDGPIINDVLLSRSDGVPGLPLLSPDIAAMDANSFDLATNSLGRARYTSPLRATDQCAKLVLINAVFGDTASAHGDTSTALAAPLAAGGLIPGNVPLGAQGDIATVAALYSADLASAAFPEMPGLAGRQNVISYFLVEQASSFFNMLAEAGGTGRARMVSAPRGMLEKFEAIFNEVLARSTTLVAAAVPAQPAESASPTGDIFYTLFQASHKPRWSGNVKKLKLVDDTVYDPTSDQMLPTQIVAAAPLSEPPIHALSDVDGRIRRDVLTFWTDPEASDVQAYDAVAGESPGVDGRSVQRGGAGQRIPGFLDNGVGQHNDEAGARQLYTQDPRDAGSLLPLDADPSSVALLGHYLDPRGLMTELDRERLLKWIRGQDSFDEDGDANLTESREWLMGDVLHSRPLIINYGARPDSGYSAVNPDVRLVYGANDGLLRVLRNTQAGMAGVESGREAWAFLPLELLSMQLRLAENSVRPQGVDAGRHPYGMDSEAVAYIRDLDRDGTIEAEDGDRVWVYTGQRRGGRNVFAFDMTDPDSPTLKWKISPATAGFQQLALTFSTPQVTHLDIGAGTPSPVLIFAGGYNGGWSGALRTGKDAGNSPDMTGNAIYVVDAASGALIWRAVGPAGGDAAGGAGQVSFSEDMIHSIPAPLTLADSEGNGLVDRAYVGDTGGNIWRVDFTAQQANQQTNSTPVSNWSVTRLAALGGSGSADRRFFHAADFVRTRDQYGEYVGVVIASGNRAAPRDELARNFVYLVKDRAPPARADTDSLNLPAITHEQLVDITQTCLSGAEPACAAADLAAGWKLQLQAAGEKGLSSPLVNNGVILFSTYLPRLPEAPDSCVPTVGSSRLYSVNLANGSARALAQSKVGQVVVDERYVPLGPGLQGDVIPYADKVLIPGSGVDGPVPHAVPGQTRWRVYWRESGIDAL